MLDFHHLLFHVHRFAPLWISIATVIAMLGASGLGAVVSGATGPLMVKDINPGASSSPTDLVAVGSKVFFTADDGAKGRELWKSNGTSLGTKRVKDIRPGAMGSSPQLLTKVGSGTIFFTANDGVHGRELWKSNGTASGTKMVKDIRAGGATSDPQNLTKLGGILYFTANNGSLGVELWRSDGTTAGTTMVKDINAGAGSKPMQLTAGLAKLFFSSDDGTGRKMWVSDGTLPGTSIAYAGSPAWMVHVGSGETVDFFAGADPGRYVYRYDDTAQTFEQLTAFNEVVSAHHLMNAGGTLYFWANDGTDDSLWKSNGTSGGTSMITTLPDLFVSLDRAPPVAIGTSIFFAIGDGTNPDAIWTSNGTAGGTKQVEGSNPSESYPENLTNVAGNLYFSAIDVCAGTCGSNDELWTSDGTDAGTMRVAEIGPGSLGSFPDSLVNVGGTLYFSANDGTHGRELWRYVP